MDIVGNVDGIVISNISGVVLAILIAGCFIMAILIPLWIYLAKKYAHDCRQELRDIKELLQDIQVENRLKSQFDKKIRDADHAQ